MVPRARFELATQGFSVLCSTTELSRHVYISDIAWVLYEKMGIIKYFFEFFKK